jgi:AcrR family transcriptional regulator
MVFGEAIPKLCLPLPKQQREKSVARITRSRRRARAIGERGDRHAGQEITLNETDPRVKRTRKLLQDAFVALLAEKSFHAISVQDIAQRATLNRATFYAHFEDKYALMDQVVRDAFREALQRRVAAAAPLTMSNLHLLVVTVFEFLGQFHGHCAPTHRDLDPPIEATVQTVQQELSAFLLGWLGQVLLAEASPTVRRETVASVMSWAILGAGIEWSRSERTLSAGDRAREVLAVIVDGLAQVVSVPSQAAQVAHITSA